MKTHGLLKHYTASQILVAALCFGTGCTLLTALSVRAELSGSGSTRSAPAFCPMVMPPFEPLERGCTFVQGKDDKGCTVFRKVCEKLSSSASSRADCPTPVFPPTRFGCFPEKVMKDGCVSFEVHCDDQSGSGSLSSRPDCPVVSMPPFTPGCYPEKAMENGCPTVRLHCDGNSGSGSAKSRSSMSARSCPEPKSADGLGFGCHVLREKSEGCDPVILCVDPPFNPNSASQLSSKPGVAPMPRCPEMKEMPKTEPGCFPYVAPTDSGCMTWKTICPNTSSAAASEDSSDDSEQESSSDWQFSSEPPAGFEEPVTPVDTPAEKNWFNDVSPDDAVGNAANELANKGIVGGYSDGTFRPEQGVNRAEAAKFLVLAKLGDFPGDIRNSGKFHDVADGEWYTKYVMAASILNIINGNPDGTFRPGSPVNTAEFLKMLTQTFELQTDLPYDYQDVGADDWFAPYAGVAKQYGLFPDRGDTLQPERTLTRGEVAFAIAQVLHAQ